MNNLKKIRKEIEALETQLELIEEWKDSLEAIALAPENRSNWRAFENYKLVHDKYTDMLFEKTKLILEAMIEEETPRKGFAAFFGL